LYLSNVPVSRLLTLLPGKPLPNFRDFAINEPKRRERAAGYTPMQLRVSQPTWEWL